MIAIAHSIELYAFETGLGWMAALTADGLLTQLAFGGDTPQAVCRRLDADELSQARSKPRRLAWIGLLVRYAAGQPVDLRDVPVELPATLTPFQRRVLKLCREIPYGQLATYGELAAKAGYPRAARAVGNVMAANRMPIVVPCHRVVPAGGKLGRYSAPGGVRTKLRLLEMEGCGHALLPKSHARSQAC